MLELKNIVKLYKTKSGDVRALNDVSLTFPSTGLVFITGKSGCGKTTLLNVIGGLDDADSGEILLLGKSFEKFTHGDLNDYRNTFIGFIFQEYNLLNEFTVEKNIEIAMELQGQHTDPEAVDALLKQVEIDGLRKRKPTELSGGQRQRLAIARALVKNPRIIMADEPTGALDSNTGIQVIETLKKLSKDKLIIVVSHDQEFAEKYADRIIKLVDGKIAQDITYNEYEINSNVNNTDEKLFIKAGAELTPAEVKVMTEAVKNNKKIEVVNSNTCRNSSNTIEENIKKTTADFAMQKSKMKAKSSLALGLKSLGVKPLRLIFTIFLSVIAFAVFGLFDTIANFTTAGVVSNLLKQAPGNVSVFGEYTIDFENDIGYPIKFSDEKVSSISRELGTSVIPVYNYNQNYYGNQRHIIETAMVPEELEGKTINPGAFYYKNSFNGFVEFNSNELNAVGFRVVEGRYPQLNYVDGVATEESLNEIAISTYMAESLIKFYSDPNYPTVASLVEQGKEKQFTYKNDTYKIVGIVDCGHIDAKYNEIKELSHKTQNTKNLVAEFEEYINSGVFRCIFTADGALAQNKVNDGVKTAFYAGKLSWLTTLSNGYRATNNEEFVYSSNEMTKENVIYFKDGYKITADLSDNEVLIHPSNITSLFSVKYNALPNAENQLPGESDDDYFARRRDKQTVLYCVNILNTNIDKLGLYSEQEKQAAMNKIIHCLYGDVASAYNGFEELTIERGNDIQEVVKVVGVCTEFAMTSTANYRFTMSPTLMNKLSICSDQGDFARLIVNPHSSGRAAGVLSNYMLIEEGVSLTWFNNSALSLVQKNEESVKQAADLFLYVALVLAVFSIFMLFNYITTSIANKRHSTGILRALGANGKDIFQMFLIESLIIAIINGIFAVILSSFGCTLVNWYIANVMGIAIPFALFGLRQVLVITLISVLTAVVSSVIPIIKIVREKPVDLIRRS